MVIGDDSSSRPGDSVALAWWCLDKRVMDRQARRQDRGGLPTQASSRTQVPGRRRDCFQYVLLIRSIIYWKSAKTKLVDYMQYERCSTQYNNVCQPRTLFHTMSVLVGTRR